MSVYKFINSSYTISDSDIEKLPTLHRYVWKGKLEKILNFLSEEEHQWKVNKKDYFQRTPMHLAGSKGDKKILQFLLSINTKSINCLDNDGCTAFYKASQMLSLECMKVLVSYGARTTCIDFKRCCIQEKLIVESGDGAVECLQYLSTHENMTSQNCVKLLHVAVKFGRLAIVKLLIQLGVDVNSTNDKTKQTPLIKAVKSDFYAITELLLTNNASVNIKDVEGKDVKDYIHDKSSRMYKIVEKYDNTYHELDEPTVNKVYVTYHKSRTVENDTKLNQQQNNQLLPGDNQTELMRRVIELEKEIKRHQESIEKETTKSHELKQDIIEIDKQRFEKESKAKPKHISEQFKRPKVLMKKIFKAGYHTKEEWVENFNNLVERYDVLQRGYEQLLLVESEKELEIEECIEVLETAEQKKGKDAADIFEMQQALQTMKTEVDNILAEKNEVKSEIEELNKLIPVEKSKFKNLIKQANTLKSKLMKNIEMLKSKKRRKMEELQVYCDEEEELLKEIEKCDQVLDGQKKIKSRIVNKMKLLKKKLNSKTESANIAQVTSNI